MRLKLGLNTSKIPRDSKVISGVSKNRTWQARLPLVICGLLYKFWAQNQTLTFYIESQNLSKKSFTNQQDWKQFDRRLTVYALSAISLETHFSFL